VNKEISRHSRFTIHYLRFYGRTQKIRQLFQSLQMAIAAGIVFILFSMAFGLYVPYLVGDAIDDYRISSWNGTLTVEKISIHAALILGANLLSGIFLFWQRRLLINASRHIEYDMRRDFYAALVNQPLEFFQNNRVGDLWRGRRTIWARFGKSSDR
jgi:ATP-binding cassette subfamily B multidrug efflux pump